MTNTAIEVENLSKRYRIGSQREVYSTLRDAVSGVFSRPLRRLRGSFHGSAPDSNASTIWALDEVSFQVKQGEIVGIIGRNGAGKTTLLRVLSRITEPTKGHATINGRISTLLEVGTGFHPELTGRENTYLNGAILGMKRSEIRRKCDGIVAFAEVEKFIDTPVKRYSSGMQVRLAFSVAAHLEPEILLIDEVLAVGDAAFQKKCLGKMGSVAREGRTILFVSHNMGAISELCSRAMLLEHGRQVADGSVVDILGAYARLNQGDENSLNLAIDPSLPCSIVGLKLCNGEGMETNTFDIGDIIIIGVTYRVATRLHGLQITTTLARNMVDVVHSFDTDALPEVPLKEPGLYQATYTVPGMFLKAGYYSVRITAGTPDQLFQDLENAQQFEIEERSINTHGKGFRKERTGLIISQGSWQTTKLE